MNFSCTFWNCCPRKIPQVTTPTELIPASPPIFPPVRLTSSIYTNDGAINWGNEQTKNLLFSKGLQDTALENYVFLFDCYRMRTLVQMSPAHCSPTEKELQTRALAKELYLKHIVAFSLLTEYSVAFNGHIETIRCAINISWNLKKQLDQLHENIDTTPIATIMNLYEQAVTEITEMLSLPPVPFRVSRITSTLGSIFTQGSLSIRGNRTTENSTRTKQQSNINQ